MSRTGPRRSNGAAADTGVIIASLRRLVSAVAPVTAPALALFLALAQSSPAWAEGSVSAGGGGAEEGGASCFFRQDWYGTWKTSPDSRSIYISASRQIYRLDLDTAYPLLQSRWAVLIDRDASNTICSAIDFRLVVIDRIGTNEPVIVRRLTRLTDAEAAALPKSLRP